MSSAVGSRLGRDGSLQGISSPDDLWQAEAAWWARVERDGFRLLRTSGLDSGPVARRRHRDGGRRLAGPRRAGDRRSRRRSAGGLRCGGLTPVAPVRMTRITLVAPEVALRDVLARVADAAVLEIDLTDREQAHARRRRRHGCSTRGKPRRAALSAAGLTSTGLSRRAAMTCWPARLSWRSTRRRRSGGPVLLHWPAGSRLTGCLVWPQRRRGRRRRGTAAASPRHRGADAAARRRAAALADSAGPDLRDGAVRRCRPDLARLGGLRADVRHDVRRRGTGDASGRRRAGLARRLAAMAAPVPAGLAVRRRGRRGGHRLRPALRGVLRPDRARADGLARSARSSDHAAAGGGGHRRDPARPGVRSRHDQPVARRRLAGHAVRTVGDRGYLPLPRRGCRRRRLVPPPWLCWSASARSSP